MNPEWVGRRGEQLTRSELNLVKLFGRRGRILQNIYIPKDNGETTEIDVVYITQKGIFVIESKNYSGWIFGNEMQRYWTASLVNGTKNSFYNPILQNKMHIKWLDSFLNHEIPLFSIIAFSERCELKKVTISSDDVHVIKRDRIYATIRSIWDSSPDVLSREKIKELFSTLRNLTYVDDAIKESHIESIQRKYNASITNKNMNHSTGINILTNNKFQTAEMLCPKCNSLLVEREAKKGTFKGSKFYGCSNFPKCRYILPNKNNN